VFVNSTPGATSGELPINHNSWQAANAMLFCPAYDLVLMHVVDVALVLWSRGPLDGSNGFLASCATRAEDLDLVFHLLSRSFISVLC
jgi:hypothetical protein